LIPVILAVVEIFLLLEYILVKSIEGVRGMVHIKWEPFRDLMAMQDRMTRLFDETLTRIWKEEMPRGGWSPPVDILEKENEVVLKVDLPEMVQSEIDIKVEENTLVIQGERKFLKETDDTNYLQIERPYGTFHRHFTIPRTIDLEKIKASYKDGVLRVVLSKKEMGLPKQIVVEGK
jgi:HSP20 family protein